MERKQRGLRIERPKAERQEKPVTDSLESLRNDFIELEKRLKIVESGNVVSSSSVKKDYSLHCYGHDPILNRLEYK